MAKSVDIKSKNNQKDTKTTNNVNKKTNSKNVKTNQTNNYTKINENEKTYKNEKPEKSKKIIIRNRPLKNGIDPIYQFAPINNKEMVQC